MKIFRLTVAFLSVLSVACSCQRQDEAPVAVNTRLEFALPNGAISVTGSTKANAENAVNNIWVMQIKGTDIVSAVYLDKSAFTIIGSSLFVDMAIKPDLTQIYAVANTGDANLYKGVTTKAAMLAIQLPGDALTSYDASKGLLMAGSMNAPQAGTLSRVKLVYMMAKVNVAVSLDRLTAGASFVCKEIKVCKIPKVLTHDTTVMPWPATDAANFGTDLVAASAADHKIGPFYMSPNRRGTGTATIAMQKNETTAPAGQGAWCTYVNVMGEYKETASAPMQIVVYKLWLGADMVKDYNIMGGSFYDVKMLIINANTIDSRITVYDDRFDLSMLPSDGNAKDDETFELPIDYTGTPANTYIAYPKAVGGKVQSLMFNATRKPRSAMAGKEGQVAHQGYNTGTDAGTSNYYTNGTYTAGAMNGQQLNTDLNASDIAKIEVVWQTMKDHGKSIDIYNGPTDFTMYNAVNAGTAFIKSITYDNTTGKATVTTRGTGNALIAAYDNQGTILWSWQIWGTETAPQANVTPGDAAVNGADKKFMDRNLGALAATTTKPSEDNAYKYFGTMYQWGRKEPFVGVGPQFTITLGSDVNSIPTAIFDKTGKWMRSGGETGNTKPQTKTLGGYTYSNTSATSTYTLLTNPTTHYYGSNAGNAGNVIKDNPNTWTPYSITVTKSIYDPCPYGYRVPINGSWTGFPKSTWTQYSINGGVAIQSTWWPASGNRNYSSAVLQYVGSTGYYWSSSRHTSNAYQAYYLTFNYNDGVTPSLNYLRSFGFPVRCVQE